MRPQKIIVMRHGESREDIDKTVYARIPDLDIPLTTRGEGQSIAAGDHLSGILEKGRVHFFLSPGVRIRQTHSLMTSRFPKHLLHSFSEEELLLKELWSDVTGAERLMLFLKNLQRSNLFIKKLRGGFEQKDSPENIVILTHGLEMRVFLTAWFKWSVQFFDSLAHPKNCEMVILQLTGEESYTIDRNSTQTL